MVYLYGIASLGLLISAIVDKGKTRKSLKTAFNMFTKMLPMLLITLSIVSIVLYFLPDYVIAKYLGTTDLLLGVIIATFIGTISLLPGFVTFPLCGLLLNQGVSYTVLAAFTTSLMMVGIVTFPIEKEYFGFKISMMRNIAAFIIALLISLIIGLIYGEVKI